VQVADDRGRTIGSALYAPAPAPIALRAYARGNAFVPFDAALVEERLVRAIDRRRAIYGEAGSSVCRLVHGEADLLPGLFVDRWGDAAVVQSATAAIDPMEEMIARALVGRLGLRLVISRDDGSMRDHEQLARKKAVLAGKGPTLVRVAEGRATLELDLMEDAKTGGFLDQRENHARAAEIARGETLDAFTYHGGFALAMAPRATSVLAIDEDPQAAARARVNAKASGFTNVAVREGDAFAVLRDFEREGRTFDVVVIDPPALAKRRGTLDTALRAYKELNLRALRITRRDGWLVTCSCSGKVTPAAFGEMLEAAARDAKREVAVVERRSAGRDHPLLLGVPETDYLKCWFAQVL
jgi:23S rRNA (cytosine1962-C5)-methyltransferase